MKDAAALLRMIRDGVEPFGFTVKHATTRHDDYPDAIEFHWSIGETKFAQRLPIEERVRSDVGDVDYANMMIFMLTRMLGNQMALRAMGK